MANNPTMTQYPAQVLNALNYYHRNGQYPLDDTSLWSTIEDFEGYISEAGSYRYPGQLVSITNGDPFSAANKKDVTLALVKPDGTVQKVGCELIFDTTTAAEAYVTANPEFAVAGKILTVKKSAGTGAANTYELYVINADKTLTRISFDQADIPEVTWDALTGKPTSAVADIDAAVTFTKKFQEIEENTKLSYNGHQIAMVSDIPTTYDATKITGTINLQNLPAGALERLYVAADEEARLALTTAEVQNGDVVKQEDTGTMYYVKDDTKLGSPDTAAQAFEVFTAGSATSVPWSGVTGTPTTLGGYGITDAVNSSEKAANYVEGGVVTWKTGTDGNTNTYQIEGKAKEAALADVATKALDSDKLGGQLPAYYAKKTDVDTINTTIGAEGEDGAPGTGIKGDIQAIKEDITELQSGSSITAIEASKITGVINETNLPDSVKERLSIVANDTARFALTSTDVQLGDIVKVTETGKMFIVKNVGALASEDGYEPITASSADSVEWANIQNKPTTVATSGLTDAVEDADISKTYAADKIVGWAQGTNATTTTQYEINGKANTACLADRATMAADAEKLGGQLPAYYAKQTDMTTVQGQIGESGTSGILKDIEDLKAGTTITEIAAEKITGVLSLDQLPKTVVERLTVVANDEARLALTSEQIQNGDTVKVTETGKMYFVKDDTKLGSPDTAAQAFEEYTVGTAGSVEWSGVLSKPTTLAGYGITDAVNSNEKVTVANAGNAGKILVLNAEGKLDADITGHVDWANINDKPTSSVTAIDQAVTLATHTNRDVLDKLTEVEGRLTYNGTGMATKPELDAISKSALQVVDVLPGDAVEGQLVLEKIS